MDRRSSNPVPSNQTWLTVRRLGAPFIVHGRILACDAIPLPWGVHPIEIGANLATAPARQAMSVGLCPIGIRRTGTDCIQLRDATVPSHDLLRLFPSTTRLMKRCNTITPRSSVQRPGFALKMVPLLAATAISLCALQVIDAQTPLPADPPAEVLTRGPVHEAFAGLVTFNPEPGILAPKAPPPLLEELTPEEKPVGENVTWIPGYWAWDNERIEFLWVSGTWRALPPGRKWLPGYWRQVAAGFQWSSGYWADTAMKQVMYLPAPPPSVEVGPSTAPPSDDYGWIPGCWIWRESRYAWQTGYWAPGRADWAWTPAHYVWTTGGYIFVGGFWDYPIARRGVLFAPVYIGSSLYTRHGYHYLPSMAIDLGLMVDHLFLFPRYQHYYFGDYYSPAYHHVGFHSSYSPESRRHGYDPIFAHQRWEHRREAGWENRAATSYENRRDHEGNRPPRNWVAQNAVAAKPVVPGQVHLRMTLPAKELAVREGNPIRLQPVAEAERLRLERRGGELQKSREQRKALDARAVAHPVRSPGATPAPVKSRLPETPIVAKPANRMARGDAPPKPPMAPGPNPKSRPSSPRPNSGPGPGPERSPAHSGPPDGVPQRR